MKYVDVRVPATTANLGSGFDCLGLALRIYNVVRVSRGRRTTPDAMAAAAGDAFFRRSGGRSFAFEWLVTGNVPRSRGLGSSVTVRLGILHGLNELAGRPLGRDALFQLCAKLEGHPDNAAPAAFGGFTIARMDAAPQRFAVDARLKFVLAIPDFEMETAAARKVLPARIAFADAVQSVSNAAGVAGAFATGRYERLRGLFADRLHQPYRGKLLPFLSTVVDAGVSAGALGGWLSGSGSTIACATVRRAQAVGDAMAAACPQATVLVTQADNTGVRILRS